MKTLKFVLSLISMISISGFAFTSPLANIITVAFGTSALVSMVFLVFIPNTDTATR